MEVGSDTLTITEIQEGGGNVIMQKERTSKIQILTRSHWLCVVGVCVKNK